jgi:SAM-dependent methyltransferase
MNKSYRFLLMLAIAGASMSVVSLAMLIVAPPQGRNVARAAATTPQEKLPRQTARPWTGSPLEFEYSNRERTLQIERVMNELKIKRGSVVADVGAGGGWFTVRAARRVGPNGLVYAQEILPKYTQFLADRAKREGLKNVRPVLGTLTDPRLPANTLDAALILNAYHEFSEPLAMLRHIYKAMKPGARLGFIERDNPALRKEAREAYAKTGKIKRRVDERP